MATKASLLIKLHQTADYVHQVDTVILRLHYTKLLFFKTVRPDSFAPKDQTHHGQMKFHNMIQLQRNGAETPNVQLVSIVQKSRLNQLHALLVLMVLNLVQYKRLLQLK